MVVGKKNKSTYSALFQMNDKHTKNRQKRPSDGDFFAFYLSILILGGLIVMPIVFSVSALAGLLGDSLSEIVAGYSYGNLVVLSVATLIPSMVAFGRDLTFEITRFLVGLGVVAYFTIKIYVGLRGSVSLPLPLGGGVVGIGVATLTGRAGVLLRKTLTWNQVRRYVQYGVASVAVIFAGLAISSYFIKLRPWDVETAIAWESKWKDVHGIGEAIDIRSGGQFGQIIDVRLESGDIVSVVQKNIYGDTNGICRFATPKIGSRVRFEGSYHSREYATDTWLFDDYDLGSSVGMVEATPCDANGNRSRYGSIVEVPLL
jgi:hypothetical protein